MNEQKVNGKTKNCGLLSQLCTKDKELDNRNASVIFVLRAIAYLDEKAQRQCEILNSEQKAHYSEYQNDVGPKPNYNELCRLVEKFVPKPESTEEDLLKKEIINLCHSLTGESDILDKKKYFYLLANCEKYKPFHVKGKHSKEKKRIVGGKNQKENYFTEVFCFAFNHSEEFKTGIISIINKLTGIVLGSDASADSQKKEKSPTRPKSNNWDIEIKDAGSSIVIENKIGALLEEKEISQYQDDFKLSKHDEYILLTCHSNDVIKDSGIGIKHISWFFGNDSVRSVLSNCKTSDNIEDIYIKYFVELVQSELAAYKKTMSFKEVEDELERIDLDLLKRFNELKKGWESLNMPGAKKTGRLPGKDGCIFYILTDNNRWHLPFKITKKGVFNVQWEGMGEGQSKFIDWINSLSEKSKIIDKDKQSFKIKLLSGSEVDNLKTFAWFKDSSAQWNMR